jgi:putative transposase
VTTPVKAVCARHNVSDATFYKWRAKYGGMDVNAARRLQVLEEENGRLKRLVADQAVQIQILKEMNSSKREWARRPKPVERLDWPDRAITAPAPSAWRVESFHDKLRDERLNREIFGSLWEGGLSSSSGALV